MHKSIETMVKIRTSILTQIEALSAEQLNQVPAGFNNNIIWNLAHMISAQQGICYMRAGVEVIVDDKYFTPYRPGTKPDGFIDADEIAIIKGLLRSTLDRLDADYNQQLFSNYTSVVTRYGVELTNIDEAITFLPFHDGLHIGSILALKKLV